MGTAVSADGKEIYVTTGRGNSVAVIDSSSNNVAAMIPVGGRAWGVALSPDGSKLYTANGATNDISVVDVKARKEFKRIKVGDGPWGVEVLSEELRNNTIDVIFRRAYEATAGQFQATGGSS